MTVRQTVLPGVCRISGQTPSGHAVTACYENWGEFIVSAALRMPAILPLAAIITVGLFLLMRALIDIGPVGFTDAPERPPVEINFDIVEAEPDRRRDMEITDMPEPPLPPDTSPVDRAVVDGEIMGSGVQLPPAELTNIEVDPRPVATDGNPIPVVRINPGYPSHLISRGVEGQGSLIFDIMPNGTTANVRVLTCTKTGFERASVQAVERWRYSPQMRNGQPEVYRGATTQLIYRIEG